MNNIDPTSIFLVALLPLTGVMLLTQTNPYHALVIRGIFGAIAAMVYALFGGADVALTEALVGTFLAMMLSMVAVRSSMTMRVGILASLRGSTTDLLQQLRAQLQPHHLRLELVTYEDAIALDTALQQEDIHTKITSDDAQQIVIETRLPSLAPLLPEPPTQLTEMS